MTTAIPNISISSPNAPNAANDTEGDQELLENVLQDIAKQTKNEKKLFNQAHDLKFTAGSEDESEFAKVSNGAKITDQSGYIENPEVVYTTYQPTPMEVLKQSFKWSAIVALLVFIFSQPRIIGKITQYLPSRLVDNGVSLNVWGSLLISLLAGIIYFVLFQWVL
jgi:hypothetical protein